MEKILQNVFACYEGFKDYVDNNLLSEEEKKLLLIQYKILYRQWKEIQRDELGKYKERKAREPRCSNQKIEWNDSDYSIGQIMEFNHSYYEKYLEDEGEDCVEIIKNITQQNNDANITDIYYTDILSNRENVIDTFFCGVYPIINVTRYKNEDGYDGEHYVQMRAANKLEGCPYHFIFDEVGTGKTVSAIYCIQDVLNKNSEKSKILIICPQNKIQEWVKDVGRQLGLYSHVVPSGETYQEYNDTLKDLYFKSGEPHIFVEGQKTTEKKKSLDSYANNTIRWDLIVIDEGHLCFKNYRGLKAEKLVFLTATPIVINLEAVSPTTRSIFDYICIAKSITEDTESSDPLITLFEPRDYTLFEPRDYCTQLFREDLGIEAKERKISFIETERSKNREYYLDALGDSVGGMARLVYEQDDEYLLYGVYERFRDKIKKKGYCLEDEQPRIENDKYKELEKMLLENESNSYIIFFNFQWPAKRIYEKLVNNSLIKENTIIALKFGKSEFKIYPNDNSVTSSNVYDYLLTKIDARKRVLFLTTGRTGGTGLNLGKFHGIINYELPFTCIELEQRFGRVDRVDVEGEEREMVFLLNKDYNPMLRYSLLKINETCKHMPIRNTILFCPEVTKRISDDLKKEIERNYFDVEECETFEKLKEYIQSEREIIKLIEEIYKARGENIEGLDRPDGLTDECVDFIVQAKTKLKYCIEKARKLIHLKNELENWLHVFGIDQDESKIVVGSQMGVPDEDGDNASDSDNYDNDYWDEENYIIKDGIKIIEPEGDGRLDIQDVFEKLKNYNDFKGEIDNQLKNLENTPSSTQEASGVFYIKDNRYHRDTVKEFREKCNFI